MKERLKTDCRVLFLLKYSYPSLRGFHYRKHQILSSLVLIDWEDNHGVCLK